MAKREPYSDSVCLVLRIKSVEDAKIVAYGVGKVLSAAGFEVGFCAPSSQDVG